MKPEELPEIFSRNLRAARLRSGKSQRALASEIGCAASSINEWETGKASPTLTSVVKLAAALEVPPELLLTGVGGEILSSVSA